MAASFWSQLKAMLWRNILLKKRNKFQLLQELLFPVFFVVIMAMTKMLLKPKTYPAVDSFPENPLTNEMFHLNTSQKLLASPNSSAVNDLMSQIQILTGVPFSLFDKLTDAEEFYKGHSSDVAAGLIFDFTGSELSYAIRTPYESVPDVGTMYTQAYNQGDCRNSEDGTETGKKCRANKYLTNGFVWLQNAVDTALIKKLYPTFPMPKVSVQMMPKDEYTPSLAGIQIASAIYFVLAYSFFINFLCVNLVAEKERKIREGMKMMGLRDSVWWLSWVTVYTLIITIVTILVVLIALASSYFANSNVFILFILLFLYGLSIINMAFFLTPFFKKSFTAGLVAGFATVIVSLLYFSVVMTRTPTNNGFDYAIPPAGRWVLCLLSPVALALAMDQAVFLDVAKGGMTFSTIMDGDFPLYAPLVMLVIDIFLYLILAIYLDHVIPGEYGPRYKPWFCLMPSYWHGSKQRNETNRIHMMQNKDTAQHESIEPVSDDLVGKEGIRIANISKTYSGKVTVKAVDDRTAHTMAFGSILLSGHSCSLGYFQFQSVVHNWFIKGCEFSLDMYEGHITAILGHNGAGKTTLINMLCGLTPPSSGSALIEGMDVSNSGDVERIRFVTGVCPQHNILYDELSCREHLYVFAGIKGIPDKEKNALVDQAMKDADIADQADVFAINLSGGQKRKLSVAIALIGNPKILFLDEPSAGMDPFSRRHLWSLLKKSKKGRIILLTTHFMDEADILADRKVIMSHGNLQCCGSSLFLKNKYGIGYHLNMVMEPTCDVDKVTELLKTHVPGVTLQRAHAKELSFIMPLAEVTKFPNMFSDLESTNGAGKSKADSLGIRSFGVSMTTLEEVFLKLGEEEQIKENDDDAHVYENLDTAAVVRSNSCCQLNVSIQPTPYSAKMGEMSGQDNVAFDGHSTDSSREVTVTIKPDIQNRVNTGGTIMGQRFWALLKIRLLLKIRNRLALIFQVILPIILVIVGCILGKQGKTPTNADPNPLTIKPFYVVKGSAPLLAIDTAASTNSGRFVDGVKNVFDVDQIGPSAKIADQPTHYMGFNIYKLENDLSSNYTALYNDTAIHSLPAIINLMSNGLLIFADNVNNKAVANRTKISCTSLAWPSVEKPILKYDSMVFSAGLIIAMAFVLITPGFAVEIVKDRQVKARSQLRVSGITFNMYWITSFLFHLTLYFIPSIICIIVVIAAQIKALSTAGAIFTLVLLFITYSPANLLLAYVFSFAFDKYEACQALLPNIFCYIGFLPYILISLLDMLDRQSLAQTLHYVFTFLDPPYIAFGGIYFIDRVSRMADINNVTVKFDMYFEWNNNIVLTFIVSLIHFVLLFLLLRFLDTHSSRGVSSKPPKTDDIPGENNDIVEHEDDDVAEERRRVAKFNRTSDHLPVSYVENLRKEFTKRGKSSGNCCKMDEKDKVKVVVRNSTFAVDAGEVLGLLGPNGAGKTTTLNMIIAETSASRGKVIVNGYNVNSNMSEAFQAIGYCPQHDALWDTITLREHLECYCAIRGVPKQDINYIVSYYINNLKLHEHTTKGSEKLSGGTRRKLSYAISMLGTPKIVLLDEPSTGMDPQSKRFLWDTISSSFQSTGRGAILTTHYMEEADALCSRVAIMVNGQVECLGPTQHLKDKFGSGYLLEIKLNIQESDVDQQMDRLESHIINLFPHMEVLERFGERGQYKIPRTDVKLLSKAFSALEEMKKSLSVEEYSFSQTTLEQVFLEFAKHQHDEGVDALDMETTNRSVRPLSRQSRGTTRDTPL